MEHVPLPCLPENSGPDELEHEPDEDGQDGRHTRFKMTPPASMSS